MAMLMSLSGLPSLKFMKVVSLFSLLFFLGCDASVSQQKPASSTPNANEKRNPQKSDSAVSAKVEEAPDEMAEEQQPQVPDFPMPDLSLLSDDVFKRNAKMGRLVAKKRCILCHKIEGRGAILQPPLVQVSMRRLKRMLSYDQYLKELGEKDPDRFSAGKKTFDAISEEADVLTSMRLWLKGYLRQPTFDNSQAKMPLQVLVPAEIDQLASYVIQLAVEGYQKGETPLED